MDFTAVNRRIIIPAGSTQVPVDIPIVDDKIHENTESFKVIIETIEEVTPPGVILVTPNPTTIHINDNDG